MVHPSQKKIIVYFHVLKGSESNESIKKLVLFWPKVVVGPRTPPPQRPTPPKNTSVFFDVAPNYIVCLLLVPFVSRTVSHRGGLHLDLTLHSTVMN